MQDAYKKFCLLDSLFVAYFRKENWDKVEEIARNFSSEKNQSEYLSQLVEAHIKRENWDKAEKIVYSVANTEIRDKALSQLFTAHFRNKNFEKAEQIVYSVANTEIRDKQLETIVSYLLVTPSIEELDKAKRIVRNINDVTIKNQAQQRINKEWKHQSFLNRLWYALYH